jgi:predicted adenine nucleotide alpha hydrolase (AANH) superfamily ATPase
MADKDIVLTILEKMKTLHPTYSFIENLYNQYCLRGGLSKKQLEGLLDKAQKTETMPTGYVATLEAIILKKPTRERAKATITAALPTKDEELGKQINEILQKYPQHKRLLFLKSKYDKNEAISTLAIEEIKKFYKMFK